MINNEDQQPLNSSTETIDNDKTMTRSNQMTYKGPYPIDEIRQVRDYFVKEFVNAPCRCKAEFHLKLKLGILTDEIIDYFKHDKIPVNMPDCFPDDDDDEDHIYIDEDYNSEDDKERCVNEEEGEVEEDKEKSSQNDELIKLSQTLALEHGCVKFCPLDVVVKEKFDPFDIVNIVYVCDFCFKMTGMKSSMEEHLKVESHFSASEYILEARPEELYDPTISPIQSSSASSVVSSQLSDRKVAFLKKRSSLHNFHVNDSFIVFCPKPQCNAFMSTNVLACALHYKYAHTLDRDVEIYSIGKFERTLEVEIEKKHSCPQCKHYHSKLLALCEHLKREEHIPTSRAGEINVFVCPFDDCHFKTTIFFAFKTHLLSHQFFISAGGEKVTCKVRVYSQPKSFYHVCRFGENSGRSHEHLEWERECERKALGDLIELQKNHNLFIELNKKLKDRKDQITPLSSTSSSSSKLQRL